MNTMWVAYAIKAELNDIIAINLLGTISSIIFILLYLYIKYKVEIIVSDVVYFITTIPISIFIFTDAFSADLTGTLAMVLNLLSYVATLDCI